MLANSPRAPGELVFQPDGTYPEIDLTLPPLPERSTLIQLLPLGRGTAAVESLWSFLHRLAGAHSVRFIDLLQHVIGKHTSQLFGRTVNMRWSGLWKHFAVSAAGAGTGVRLARVTAKLTGWDDLRDLTHAFAASTTGLAVHSRGHQVWCPHCLATDSEPYERLLWTFAGVTHCDQHKAPLQRHCHACHKPQQQFSGKSDILLCVHCGASKSEGIATQGCDEFGAWTTTQAGLLIETARTGQLVSTNIDVRSHNLRITTELNGIGGITGLAKHLRTGRTTPWSWLNEDRAMPLEMAARWAWLVGASIPELFSRKLDLDELNFRGLPESFVQSPKATRNKSVPHDSPKLYLTALQLHAANPFVAPRTWDLVRNSGVHLKHPAFREIHFRRLMRGMRNRERVFRHKERVWREICDVHSASIRVANRGDRLGRHRVGAEMVKPGHFGGDLARKYLRWFKARLSAGDRTVLEPKIVPADVRAFWSLTTKN